MKKLIFITVILLLLPTLCIAQPHSELSSIQNTTWKCLINPIWTLGFADGDIYACEDSQCEIVPDSLVEEMGFLTLFAMYSFYDTNVRGVAIPLLGVGVFEACFESSCFYDIMYKASDNFFPN